MAAAEYKGASPEATPPRSGTPVDLENVWGGTARYAAASLVVKFMAFAKDLLIAARFGTHWTVDAFVLALHIVSLPALTVLAGLQTALIPPYTRLLARDPAEAAILRRRLGTLGLGTGLALAAALFLLAPLLRALFGASFPAERGDWFEDQLRLLSGFIAITGLAFIAHGLLQVERRLLASGLIPVAIPAATLALLLAFPSGTATLLAIGILLGAALEALAARLILARRPSARQVCAERDPKLAADAMREVRREWRNVLPALALAAAIPVVDSTMASWLGEGAVASLNYAQKIPSFLLGLVLVPLSTALLPHLSRLVAAGALPHARAALGRVVAILLAASVPLTALLVAFSPEVTRLLWGRGAIGSETIEAIAAIQQAYLLQVPFALVATAGGRLLSAAGRNSVHSRITAVLFVLNIVLNAALMIPFGAVGIALATSIVNAASAAFVLVAITRLAPR